MTDQELAEAVKRIALKLEQLVDIASGGAERKIHIAVAAETEARIGAAEIAVDKLRNELAHETRMNDAQWREDRGRERALEARVAALEKDLTPQGEPCMAERLSTLESCFFQMAAKLGYSWAAGEIRGPGPEEEARR